LRTAFERIVIALTAGREAQQPKHPAQPPERTTTIDRVPAQYFEQTMHARLIIGIER
jgi:hypothetical protein